MYWGSVLAIGKCDPEDLLFGFACLFVYILALRSELGSDGGWALRCLLAIPFSFCAACFLQ